LKFGWAVDRLDTMTRAGGLLLWAGLCFAQGGATVEGTVTNSVTHAGIAGVDVRLRKGSTGYAATTDASGKFVVTGVQPGEYDSRFEKSGFVIRDAPMFGKPPLRVGASGTVEFDIELDPFAALRGRVTDPDGRPVAKATVELDELHSTTADEDGRFEFQNLWAGTYTLRARPAAARREKESGGEKEPIVPTYFPSMLNVAEAQRIVLRAGADLDGYDIRLRQSPVYHIRGIVLDENGKPVPDCPVQLVTRTEDRVLTGRMKIVLVGTQLTLNSSGVLAEEASVKSGKDGTFDFASVFPGEWRVRALLDPRLDEKQNMYLVWSNLVSVRVADQDVVKVELRFSASFTVEIVFDFGDRPPPAGSRMPVVTLSSLENLPMGLGNRKTADGIAIDHVLPGRYHIVTTPGVPAGYYPASITVGGRDVTGQDVDLSAGMPPIRILLKPNAGHVRGTVSRGAGATVLLWPEGSAIPFMVLSSDADEHGSFQFANVPPGNYSVVAFDNIPLEGGAASTVLGAIAAGTRVEVQEGGAQTVELNVTRWPE
jgi:hypothetical protein